MLDLDDADNLEIKPFDVELYVGDDQNLLFTRALENRPELVAAEHVADSSHCQEAYKLLMRIGIDNIKGYVTLDVL